MKPATARYLTGAEGRLELERLAAQNLSESNRLAVLTRLRRHLEPEIAGALMEQAMLRQKAVRRGKFSRGGEMFFTPDGLEQSSGENIARYRAGRMREVLGPGARVAEFGCGIGGDTLALSEHFEVTAVDLDALRLEYAAANLELYGRKATFVKEDITRFEVNGYDAVFFDPARRTGEGKRIFSVLDYSPPLSLVNLWLEKVPQVAVKISPGVAYAELAGYDCEVEIISENGDVKEAVLWFGAFKTTTRRATLLPTGNSLIHLEDKAAVLAGTPLGYLYEPDGAVIRAGLVEELALQMGGTTRKIDDDIAFLTSEEPLSTPFARCFKIVESLPWNLKKLNRRLQELETGRVVVKKRGSPVDPQQLERALKLKGHRELVVVLTHVLGQPYVILCANHCP